MSSSGHLFLSPKILLALQVKAGSEGYKAETDDLRKILDMVKDEGTDMKLEIQGLKNVEKLFKVRKLQPEDAIRSFDPLVALHSQVLLQGKAESRPHCLDDSSLL